LVVGEIAYEDAHERSTSTIASSPLRPSRSTFTCSWRKFPVSPANRAA